MSCRGHCGRHSSACVTAAVRGLIPLGSCLELAKLALLGDKLVDSFTVELCGVEFRKLTSSPCPFKTGHGLQLWSSG